MKHTASRCGRGVVKLLSVQSTAGQFVFRMALVAGRGCPDRAAPCSLAAMLTSQRDQFDIPPDICYLNAASYSPLPLKTQDAARAASFVLSGSGL